MKNIPFKILAFLTILLFISNTCMAQELNFTLGVANPNPNLDKFVGTWKWQNGNKSFTIVLKKQNITLPPIDKNVTADIIYGFHQYNNGSEIIETSLNFQNTNFNDKKSTILGGTRYRNNQIIKGSIDHLSKNKSVNFEIEYINDTQIKLVSLENPPGIKLVIDNQPDYDWEITLPQDIVLTKL